MKHLWIRKLLAGISLTSVLFIFQACYGTPHDAEIDINIKGTVKSETSGLPIEGIKITAHNTNQTTLTDTNGRFSFYTELSNTYRLIFEDIDSTANGAFLTKDTVIINSNNDIDFQVFLQDK